MTWNPIQQQAFQTLTSMASVDHLSPAQIMNIVTSLTHTSLSNALAHSGLTQSEHSLDKPFSEFDLGGTTLSVWDPSSAGREFHANTNAIALHTDDVNGLRAELEGRGVTFFGETLDTGVCHMAFFADVDGNPLMLHGRYAPRG